jgi:hypothetical protein
MTTGRLPVAKARSVGATFSETFLAAIFRALRGSDTYRFQSISTCRRVKLPRDGLRFSLALADAARERRKKRRRLSRRASRKAFGLAMSPGAMV